MEDTETLNLKTSQQSIDKPHGMENSASRPRWVEAAQVFPSSSTNLGTLE